VHLKFPMLKARKGLCAMSGSEIARLLQQIREEEVSARRALHDPAITAKHQFMTKRTENIGRHVTALAQIVGSEEKAIDMVIADHMQQETCSPVNSLCNAS